MAGTAHTTSEEKRVMEALNPKPKVKKPKSQSKKIRDRIYIIWEKEGKKGDPEEYYNKITNWFIKQLDKQIDKLDSGLG